MTVTVLVRSTAVAAALTLTLTAPSSAQSTATGPVLSAVGSAVMSDDHTGWGGSVSFGYQFNSTVELQVELTGTPEVRRGFEGPRIAANRQATMAESFVRGAGQRGIPAASLPSTSTVVAGLRTAIFPVRDEPDRALFFTTNARVHLPLTTTRIVPYVTAGGGVGHLQRTQVIDYGPLFLQAGPLGTSLPFGPGIDPAFRQEYTFSETTMVLTLGGGAAFKLTDRFSVDVDLRAFRSLGNEDTTIGRFGGGMSYRF